MKKLILLFCFIATCSTAIMASGNYKLNDQEIDELFINSTEVEIDDNLYSPLVAQGGQTVGGYLIRSFFCGCIGLHRSYMGTGGETLWWKYLCIPIVGSVVSLVDFWWVVFKGADALNKYNDNGKFIVWLD